MLRSINAVPTRDLFTLWWKERWIRLLVLSLVPIALLDALFTLLLVEEIGAAAEMNPLGRMLLVSGSGVVWLALNCVGFTLFCMMTGSYYLAARERASEPDTGFLAFLISLRVGMVGYNATYYYVESVGAGYPPIWAGLASTVLSYMILARLLKLPHNLSRKWLGLHIATRMDNVRDLRLMSSVGRGNATASKSVRASTRVSQDDPSLPGQTSRKAAWMKRGGYMLLWVGALFGTMIILQIMFVVSGTWDWTTRPQGWVSLDGAWFLAFFGVIIVFIIVSMMLIVKAFDVSEYPV